MCYIPLTLLQQGRGIFFVIKYYINKEGTSFLRYLLYVAKQLTMFFWDS